MDVLIFAGQSNMQGSAGEKDDICAVDGCFEYRYISDSLIPLKNPTGEDINDSLYATRTASMLPYFCEEYHKKTGKPVVALHTARGDTKISEWQKGTKRFDDLVKKIESGVLKVKENYTLEKVYFIWLQGESDANEFVGKEHYSEMLVKLKNDLKERVVIDKFALIRQGYFATYASWVKGSFAEKRKSDRAIMRALDETARTDGDFYMLTRICAKLSEKKEYLDPNGCGPHYNLAGLKLIGKKAGNALAKLRNKL